MSSTIPVEVLNSQPAVPRRFLRLKKSPRLGPRWGGPELERARRNARALWSRAPQFIQKLRLDLFVCHDEAVARRDSTEFALTAREVQRRRWPVQPGPANG